MRLSHFNNIKGSKGFTLIELLVVVAIIGVLSSVVLGSLNIARAKGRDVKRYTELKQLQTALELYRLDNGIYPTLATFHTFSIDGCRGVVSPANSLWSAATSLGKLITGGHTPALPVDPSNSITDGLCYTYTSFEPLGSNTGWTCTSGSTTFDPDGLNASSVTSGSKYAYVITFKTETSNLNLPLWLNSAKTYCLLGPIIG